PIIVSSNNGYYIYPWQWEFDNFTGFSDPVIKNDKIVFVGFNSSSIKYTLCLADLSQSSPIDTLLSASPFSPISGTGITTISGISFDGEIISFLGTERINNFPYTPNGIFLYNSGGLHTLVDLTTPVPGQSNTFVEFGNSLAAGYPAISDGKLS